MAAKPKDDAGHPFLLEAHYYSGGLRVRPLGSGTKRPVWAPETPDRYVGFRDEFALQPDDVVVEFARFAVGSERLTWIGLFYRASDSAFGDRGGHAGAGVWLRDQRVRDFLGILYGLREIAAGVAKEGIESVGEDADAFLGSRYLPTYIAPATALPAQLDGWRFSATPLSETALFIADEANERDAWNLVAEQLARMSVLPGPLEAQSRALILVRPAATDRRSGAEKGFQPIKRGLPSELLATLPDAIADIATENRTLTEGLRAARDQAARAEAAMRDASEGGARLKARVAELEQQLSANDLLRRLASIDSRLDSLVDSGSYASSQLSAVAREVQGLRPTMRNSFPNAAPVEGYEQPGPVVGTKRRWWKPRPAHLLIALLLTVFLATLIMAVWGPTSFWPQQSPPLPPLKMTVIDGASPASTP